MEITSVIDLWSKKLSEEMGSITTLWKLKITTMVSEKEVWQTRKRSQQNNKDQENHGPTKGNLHISW
jgi:hypothetical protein